MSQDLQDDVVGPSIESGRGGIAAEMPWFGKVINGCDPSALSVEYIQRNRSSGVRAFATTVAIKESFAATCEAISSARESTRLGGAHLLMSKQDIISEDKYGVILATQNTMCCDGSLLLLDALVDLGVRMVQLTYNEQNLVGSGCTETEDSGLSDFGISVVKRLEERGVVIDLSHCGGRTVKETLDIVNGPAVFSHANCYELCPNIRNRSDDEIRAVAASGGVMGLCAFPHFIDERHPDVDGLARHAAYVAELTSSDSVSLGLDFFEGRSVEWIASLGYKVSDGGYPPLTDYPDMVEHGLAKGIQDITCLANLAVALERVGFSGSEVSAIFAGNLRRVFASVWPEGCVET